MTAAKNEVISWLLNFIIRVFLKSAFRDFLIPKLQAQHLEVITFDVLELTFV